MDCDGNVPSGGSIYSSIHLLPLTERRWSRSQQSRAWGRVIHRTVLQSITGSHIEINNNSTPRSNSQSHLWRISYNSSIWVLWDYEKKVKYQTKDTEDTGFNIQTPHTTTMSCHQGSNMSSCKATVLTCISPASNTQSPLVQM